MSCSEKPKTSATDFRDIFYNNASSIQASEIQKNFTGISGDNSSTENEELSDLSSNLRDLTTHMKASIEKDKNTKPASRPILGRSKDSNQPNDEEPGLDKASTSHINHLLRTAPVDINSNDVEILQADPNDPLYSVKSFQELNLKNDLLRGVLEMKFRKPSAIQEKALPMLLGNVPKNLIAQAQSGTGKTATFLLTMLSRIDTDKSYCQCLCMAPTRELAVQIAEVALTMSKFMKDLNIVCAVKGQSPITKDGEVCAQIVIGTPGTISFWIKDEAHIYINPRKVKVFVLDEADVLIENPEFKNISKRIKCKLNTDCQLLLFSATYDERIMDFAREFVPSANEIRVKPQELTLKNIKQYYIKMKDPEEKYKTLIEIFGMRPMGQCIIFCESRRMATSLQKQLERDGHLSSLLTGELDVVQREKEIGDFRNGKSRVLIATNLCSRGIDISQVNLIINWDMPKTKDGLPDCETYIHRIGRSGRFGKQGFTVNFIVTEDDIVIQEKVVKCYDAKVEEMKDLEIIASIK